MLRYHGPLGSILAAVAMTCSLVSLSSRYWSQKRYNLGFTGATAAPFYPPEPVYLGGGETMSRPPTSSYLLIIPGILSVLGVGAFGTAAVLGTIIGMTKPVNPLPLDRLTSAQVLLQQQLPPPPPLSSSPAIEVRVADDNELTTAAPPPPPLEESAANTQTSPPSTSSASSSTTTSQLTASQHIHALSQFHFQHHPQFPERVLRIPFRSSVSGTALAILSGISWIIFSISPPLSWTFRDVSWCVWIVLFGGGVLGALSSYLFWKEIQIRKDPHLSNRVVARAIQLQLDSRDGKPIAAGYDRKGTPRRSLDFDHLGRPRAKHTISGDAAIGGDGNVKNDVKTKMKDTIDPTSLSSSSSSASSSSAVGGTTDGTTNTTTSSTSSTTGNISSDLSTAVSPSTSTNTTTTITTPYSHTSSTTTPTTQSSSDPEKNVIRALSLLRKEVENFEKEGHVDEQEKPMTRDT